MDGDGQDTGRGRPLEGIRGPGREIGGGRGQMGILSRGSVGEKQKTGEGDDGEYFTQDGVKRRACGDTMHESGEVTR